MVVGPQSWYEQNKWYAGGLAPIMGGAWAMPEIYLVEQGAYNNHRIRATLVDASGAAVASDEVTGIVRTNGCMPSKEPHKHESGGQSPRSRSICVQLSGP